MADALDYPAMLIEHDAEIDRESEADQAAWAAESGADSARELIEIAIRWLGRAAEPGLSDISRKYTDRAAGHLHSAGRLAPDPHAAGLLRLALRLRMDLEAAFGRLDDCTLDDVADDARAIEEAMKGGSDR